MARTKTQSAPHANNAHRGGSRIYLDIRPRKDVERMAAAYAEDPSEPAVVLADPERAIFEERIFVQVRFVIEDQDGNTSNENDEWLQANVINFPDLNVTALKRAYRDMYNPRRAALGLEPTAPDTEPLL